MSVLLTVNILSHNPAEHGAVLIIFPLNLQQQVYNTAGVTIPIIHQL